MPDSPGSWRAGLRRRRTARIAGVMIALAAVGGLIAYAIAEERRLGAPAGTPPERPPVSDCTAGRSRSPEPRRPLNAPDLKLKEGVDYSAVISTTCGDIELDLLEKQYPGAVANFIFLARRNFYDGLEWLRIERNFIIQTGDPNNDISELPDGPGYSIPVNPPAKANEYVYGVAAFAHEGPTGDDASQFFIVVHDSPLMGERQPAKAIEPAGLQKLYTPFGTVAESSYQPIDTISIQQVRGGNTPGDASRPVVPIYIISIEILEDGSGG